ncbi:MAG: HAD family hydrolase [Chthoniobacterales bacterium]
MSLRTLFFDLDDTLILDKSASHSAFMLVAKKASEIHGVNPEKFVVDAKAIAQQRWEEGACYPFCNTIGISAFECLWGNFFGETSELKSLRTWALNYRKEVFCQALAEQGVKADSGELAEDFIAFRRSCQRLMPSAREVLEILSKNFKLGLLTNGAPDLQREKIKASGLEEFFSAIVISGEYGIGKPSSAIFKNLLALLKVTAKEALMVGNSLERDIAGARNAGILSAWIRVPGSEEEAEARPDFIIHELSELLPLVEQLP